MSLDRSLKSASALVRHRNVLTRDERLTKLKEDEKWRDGQSVYGLPKVGHRKAAVAKTVKEEAAADGTAAVPAAGAAKGAAGAAKGAAGAAKGAAAPAKGAAPAGKAAAPAAKGAAPAAKKK